MIIDIKQHKIAIGDKYRIYVNGQERFKARTKIFKLLSEITVTDLNDRELLTINRKWNWLKARYDISFPDGKTFTFLTKSLWRNHFIYKNDRYIYDIYGHKRRKVSILRNNTQIAFFDKEAITKLEGDNYTITADDDADMQLLISFTLIWDNYKYKKRDGKAVTYDYGRIGPEAKKFNKFWTPKTGEDQYNG